MKISKESIPALKIALGAFIISFSGVYVKVASVGPNVSGFYRVFIGGIILILIAVLKKDAVWKDSFTFFLSLLCGLIFAVNLYVWHRSIHYIGPGLATIMGNFQVFIVSLAGVLFLSEKLSLRQILAMPFAIAGLFLVVGKDWVFLGGEYKTGLILGAMTAFCYSFYLLILRRIQNSENSLSPVANLAVTCLSAAFFSGILILLNNESFSMIDLKTFLVLIAYGGGSQVAGWVLITSAMPDIRASVASLLLLVQPAMSFVWDIYFFDLKTNIIGISGVLMTLCAIYAGSLSENSESGSKT